MTQESQLPTPTQPPLVSPLTSQFSYFAVCYFCGTQTQTNGVQLCETCVEILIKMHEAIHQDNHAGAVAEARRILLEEPESVVVHRGLSQAEIDDIVEKSSQPDPLGDAIQDMESDTA